MKNFYSARAKTPSSSPRENRADIPHPPSKLKILTHKILAGLRGVSMAVSGSFSPVKPSSLFFFWGIQSKELNGKPRAPFFSSPKRTLGEKKIAECASFENRLELDKPIVICCSARQSKSDQLKYSETDWTRRSIDVYVHNDYGRRDNNLLAGPY